MTRTTVLWALAAGAAPAARLSASFPGHSGAACPRHPASAPRSRRSCASSTATSAPAAPRSGSTTGALASSRCSPRPTPATAAAATAGRRTATEPCRCPRPAARAPLDLSRGSRAGPHRAVARLAPRPRHAGRRRRRFRRARRTASVSTSPTISARQLSVGIENVQLLEEMLRQRRLLEDTFNSLVDLVVVTDRELPRRADERRVCDARRAVARRAARSPARTSSSAATSPNGQRVGPTATCRVEAARVRASTTRLGGNFVVTMTPLIDEDGDPVGTVLVARDITRAGAARSRARDAARAAGAVREAGVARTVRRRHRARDQQSAAGRARTPRAAARGAGTAGHGGRRTAACAAICGGSISEADRAAKIVQQPADVLRLAAQDRAAGCASSA